MRAIGAQGEVRIFKIESLPADVKALGKEENNWIIGHSETGHHHILLAERAKVYEANTAPEGMRVLYAVLESAGQLKHLRESDTHDPHDLDPGIYVFRCDREYDPYAELARRAAD